MADQASALLKVVTRTDAQGRLKCQSQLVIGRKLIGQLRLLRHVALVSTE
jgi:hypothetical protein